MEHLEVWAVTGLMVLLGSMEALAGRLKGRRPKEELWVDFVALAQFAGIIKPAIVLMSAYAVGWAAPSWTPLASWPWPLAVLGYVLVADLLHYFYHRLGHTTTLFWQLHKTHHTATAMSISISYRENWLYFLLMPDLWLAGALVALGGAEAVVIGQLIFGLANVLIHSAFAWDAWLFRHPWVAPVGHTLERIVQLPSARRAHHALTDEQGRPPHVKFGQLLMVWDVVFGTAPLPHGRSPKAYGIDPSQEETWVRQLWLARRKEAGDAPSASAPNQVDAWISTENQTATCMFQNETSSRNCDSTRTCVCVMRVERMAKSTGPTLWEFA